VKLRIFFVILSLVVVGGGLYYVVNQKSTDARVQQRKARQIGEYGLQKAYEKLYEDPHWREGFSKQPYLDGTYSVVFDSVKNADSLYLTVISKSHVQSSSYETSSVLVKVGEGAWRMFR